MLADVRAESVQTVLVVSLQLGMLMKTSLRQMFVAAGTLLCFSDRLSV